MKLYNIAHPSDDGNGLVSSKPHTKHINATNTKVNTDLVFAILLRGIAQSVAAIQYCASKISWMERQRKGQHFLSDRHDQRNECCDA